MRASAPDMDERFASFLRRFQGEDFMAGLARDCGMAPAAIHDAMETYGGEARIGLRLVAPMLADKPRILDVGCGFGLLTAFLAEQGYEVTGLEPGAAGFGMMRAASAAVRSACSSSAAYALLADDISKLAAASQGKFDLIYSINVLEHVSDLDGAIGAMAGLLAPGGRMLHLCPNYQFPYDPHFGIPLLPMAPRLTHRLWRARIARNEELWNELNFITARRVRRLAHRHGLAVEFDRGVMADYVRRAEWDPTFRRRQGAGLAGVARYLRRAGLDRLIDRLPPTWASPMVARLRHTSTAVGTGGGEQPLRGAQDLST